MGNSLSRRAVLAGATTSTLALAMPAIATAGQSETMTDLMRRWQELDAIIASEGKAVDALEQELQTSAPPIPAILMQSVTVPEGGPLVPYNSNGWTLEVLESLIASISYPMSVRQDLPTGFQVSVTEHPLPREALATVKAIRKARLDHDAATEAHFADHAQRQADWGAMLDEQDHILQAIVDHRPTGWPDLHSKVDWLRSSGALKRIQDCSDDVGLAGALVADVLALGTMEA
jgi:hypothetical protein